MTYPDELHDEGRREGDTTMGTCGARGVRAGDRLENVGHGPIVRLSRPWATQGGRQWQRWIDARRAGITATNVAAILGMSPYQSPLGVWDEKVNGTTFDLSGEYPVARGNHMEAFLADWWARSGEGRTVRRAPALLAHPDNPLILASLDRLGTDGGEVVVVECKSAGWRQREAWWDDGQLIPDHYAVQVLTQLWVTGLERAVVVADVAGESTSVTIMRDQDWERAVWPILERFWRRVADRIPPEEFDPVEDYAALHRAWLPVPKSAREADFEESEMLLDWARTRAAAAKHEAESKRLRGLVRAAMRDVQALTIGGEVAATISGHQLRVGKALKEEKSHER